MRSKLLFTTLLVLALSIVSTTFVFLALTSKNWASQEVLSTDPDEFGIQDVVVCTSPRSPFYRCGYPQVDENATCVVPNCQFYRPSGRNQTSCRSPEEFGSGSDDIVGAGGVLAGKQECQNGNLQIAASFFITLALVLLLFLALVAFLNGTFTDAPVPDTASQEDLDGHEDRRHRQSDKTSRLTPFAPHLVLFILFSLYVGVACQVLAQYFGVLGLTINATPMAISNIAGGGLNINATYAYYGLGTWTIDRGLNIFATVAWTSALVCAGFVGIAFRTPRFEKIM